MAAPQVLAQNDRVVATVASGVEARAPVVVGHSFRYGDEAAESLTDEIKFLAHQ
jgi:hypothetical protein